MTQSARAIQRSKGSLRAILQPSDIAGMSSTAASNFLPTSPRLCGLFSKDQVLHLNHVDLDKDLDYLKPKMDSQVSILSTDSGILPTDIRNSSFVDDVIEELTSQGIQHSDIISGGVQQQEAGDRPRKRRVEFAEAPAPAKVIPIEEGEVKRIKNNEASRKSRANRKRRNVMKEQQIAELEAENQRLSLLLKDFTETAASCKLWIVERMETNGLQQ